MLEDHHVEFVRGCRRFHNMLLQCLGSFQAWLYDYNAEGLDYHFPTDEDREELEQVQTEPLQPASQDELILVDELDGFLEPWTVAINSLVEYPMVDSPHFILCCTT